MNDHDGITMRKALVSWLIVVVLLASSVAGLAQSGGYYEGFEDGRAAAREDIDSTVHCVAGFTLGIFYVGYSVLSEGRHPTGARMSSIRHRSVDYQVAYRESYTEEWKRSRTNSSLLGWGLWVAVVVAASAY